MVVIDYIQLMRASNANNSGSKISEITQGLKALAKELSVPIGTFSTFKSCRTKG